MIYTYHYDSPLGGITLSSNGTKLTGLWFDRQKYFGDTIPKEYQEKRLPIFDADSTLAGYLFQRKSSRFHPAAFDADNIVSQNYMGNYAEDSIWKDNDLR